MKGFVNLTHTNNGKINELGDKIDNLTKNAQSDWEQTDESALDYIKNKPIIPEGSVLYPTTGQHTDGAMTQKAVTTELNRLSDNVSQLSNPNLLINGDFSINQRGQEEYGNASRYTVDRWQLSTRTNVNISFNASTKTLSNTGTSSGYFMQIIEPNDVDKIWGKTWTFSVKVNGNIYSKTFTAPSTAPTTSQGIAPTLVCIQGLCQIRLFYYASTGTIGFTFDIWQGSVTIEYAKLELGSVATPFSPRPYAEELALCQRRYLKYSPSNSYAMIGTGIVSSSSTIIIGVSLPVTLRTAPTITANGNFYVRTTSATYTTNNNALTLTPAGLCNNVLQIEIASANTSFTNGDCAVLRVSDNTAYLEINAEIYQ